MAKDAISEYDSTAANNTVVGDVNVNEGCPPSSINNGIREIMSHLKDMDAGTSALTSPQITSINLGHASDTTLARTSAGVLSIEGVDVTTISATQTLTNKTLTSPKINEDVVVSATATEINKLDGVTATTTELNYTDVTTLGTSEASKAVTADANGNVNLSEELQVKSYLETVVALSAGATVTLDLSTGNVFTLTTNQNTTFVFNYGNIQQTTNDAFSFILQITSGGSHSLTFPSSVKFAGGTAPDAPASGEIDTYVFYTKDGGTRYDATLAVDAGA